MIRFLFLFASAVALPAQPLSYGFKIGSPIDDPGAGPDPFSTSSPSRWTGGPTVELHLPVRLSVELDALYRSSRANRVLPLRFDPALNPSLHFIGEETKVWDFPLLLKHRLTGGSVRPFVSAGASWSHRRNEGNSLGLCMGPEGSCYPPEFPFFRFGGVYKSSNTRFGPAGGAGFELRTEHVTITPEVRWNHWSGNNRRHVAVSWGSRSAAN
jgi:hypothetical protein